jgi:hypothetical protein
MQTDLPFFESAEDALKAAVMALGGTKQVGHTLWPDKTVDNAGRLLSDCLNAGRAEKLEPAQALLIESSSKTLQVAIATLDRLQRVRAA